MQKGYRIFTFIFLFLLFIPFGAFGYEAYGFSFTGSPEEGFVLIFPEGQVYYLDWIGSRMRTAGTDGTCYFYSGENISQCTLQEYSIFLAERIVE